MMNVRIKNVKRRLKDTVKKIITRRYYISLRNLAKRPRYYIIRRNAPWAGFFANYLYVAAHMEYALWTRVCFPVVDMGKLSDALQ